MPAASVTSTVRSTGKVSGFGLVDGGFGAFFAAESFLAVESFLVVSRGSGRGPGLASSGATERQRADAAFTPRARTSESLSEMLYVAGLARFIESGPAMVLFHPSDTALVFN